MEQAINPRRPRDWTAFESYVDQDEPLPHDRLTMRQTHWIRYAAPNEASKVYLSRAAVKGGAVHFVPNVILGKELTSINQLHVGRNLHYVAVNQAHHLMIHLAAQNQIISNYLRDRYSTTGQVDPIMLDAGLASLIGDSLMVPEQIPAEPRQLPRYLNQLAMAIIGVMLLSAGLIFFFPKVGIVLAFIAFVGVAIVGARVDDWKRMVSQGDQTNGV